MEKMKLSELIKIYHDVQEEKISQEEFVKILDQIWVTGHISLREKIASVINVLFGFEYDEQDILERYMQLEMNKFWYILMVYIDIEFEFEYATEENYELLFPLFYESIKKIAGYDFDYTMNLFNEIKTDIQHDGLLNSLGELSNTDFSELIKADNDLISQINNNQDMIKNLVELFNHANPVIGEINEKIGKKVVKKINKTEE